MTRGPRCLGVAFGVLLAIPSGLSAQPTELTLVGSLDGAAELVMVVGDHAYVSAGNTLRVVDISNPSQPLERAAYTAPDRIYGLHAAGHHVYLATGLAGLHILDVSSPDTPRHVATHETPGQAVDVTTLGTTALVVNLMTGLEIVDITNDTAPMLLVTKDTPGYQRAVTAGGSYGVVVDQPTGVVFFDLSNPRVPTERGTHPSVDAPARSVVLDNDGRAYVVYERTSRVEIIDVADPQAPRLLGAFVPTGRPERVAVQGTRVFVPNGPSGVDVVDVTDPTMAVVVATYDTPGTARAVATTDDDLIVVADDNALLLLGLY